MHGDDDLKFMLRCLDLASKAEGMTYPNPIVGSVIVYDDKIIGEGYHLKAGGPHAEVIAIESVKNRELLASSTLYVNLEPCSHFGKTPPCTDLIILNRIPRIVIGTADTSDKVSGKGIARLQGEGFEVVNDVAKAESRWINRRFFKYHEKKRPYITLKWAQSRDGFIDMLREPSSGTVTNWITGKPEKILVHKWRASEQAILVGAGTVRADNPKLNVREWTGNNPVRVILNGSGILPPEPEMNKSEGTTLVFTYYPGKVNMPGAVVVGMNNYEPSALQVSEYLFKCRVQSLFIEGGTQVLSHFISTGFWDEARIFTGNRDFKSGIKAPEIEGKVFSRTKFSNSSLEILVKPENS